MKVSKTIYMEHAFLFNISIVGKQAITINHKRKVDQLFMEHAFMFNSSL